MNLIGHLACAQNHAPAFQLGSILPDLLGMMARRPRANHLVKFWRARKQVPPYVEAIIGGIDFHHRVDARFHGAPLFRDNARTLRETLLLALGRFDAEPAPRDRPRLAIDLGCGTGRDAVEILRRGWRLLAIDAEKSAVEALRTRPDLPSGAHDRLETRVERFERADLPMAHLINSSFALPGCRAATFPGLWRRIVGTLAPGGRFAGQLYGDRDSWSDPQGGRPGMTFLTRAQVDALLEPLDVEFLREEEDESVTPQGEAKHWHIFHIVARKT